MAMFSTRSRAAAAALAGTGAVLFASAAAVASGPASAPRIAHAAKAGTLMLHSIGTPKGGDGYNVISESWGTLDSPLGAHIRDHHPDNPRLDTEEWNTPSMYGKVRGPLDRPLAARIEKTGKVGCTDPNATPDQQAYLDSTQAEFAKAQRSNALQIDALVKSDARRAKLSAGPDVGGRATVEAVIRPGVGSMTPIVYVDFDAKTGKVRRIQEAQNLPTGLVKGQAYMDFSLWELVRVDAATLKAAVVMPAALSRRCK